MKPLKYIIMTYFRQHFFGVIGIIVAIVLFFTGFFWVLKKPADLFLVGSQPVRLFLFASLIITYNIAMNLRRLIESAEFELLPRYRYWQNIGTIILLSWFILFPSVFMAFYGFPVLTSLAAFLSCGIFMLWLLFYFSDNLLIFTFILWQASLAFDIFGLSESPIISDNLSRLSIFGSKELLYLIITIISLFLYGLFLRKYLTVPLYKIQKGRKNATNPWMKDHDKLGPGMQNIVMKKFRKNIAVLKNNGASLIQNARCIRFSMFSPAYTLFSNSLFVSTIILFYIATVKYLIIRDNDIQLSNAIDHFYYLFFLLAGILSSDFVQHRNRLSFLWLSSGISSRNKFNWAIMLAYSIVQMRFFLTMSAVLIISPLLFQEILYSSICIAIIIGLIINLIIMAFTFICGEYIRSADGRGWTLTVIPFGMIILSIFTVVYEKLLKNSTDLWFVLGAAGVLSLWLLFISVKRWNRTEYDYAGG